MSTMSRAVMGLPTIGTPKPNVTTEIRLDDGSINIDSLDAQEYSTEAYMTNVFDAERKT